MGSGVFGVALSGLNAAQSGLLATSHNVSNASTPGYSRQEIRQQASLPQFTGGGFLGRGVEVTNVVRAYDDFLEKSVLSADTAQGYLQGMQQQMDILDGIVADPTVGLSPAVQDFFKGVQNTTSNPASVPSRQQFISLGNALATRYQQLNDRLQEVRQGVNEQISTTVAQINAYATKLADLNNQISAVSGSGKLPNDLLDQRDAVIEDLNKLVKVTATPQDDGSLSVVIGSGQSLVLGGVANTLAVAPGLADPQNLEVSFTQGLINVPIPTSLLTGGKLSALLNFRTNSLDLAQNSLGRVAMGMARAFNEQNQLGIDLNGQPGGDMFTVGSPNVISYANNGGTGLMSASIASAGELTTSDYRVFRTAAGYDIVRLSDNYKQSVASAGPLNTTMDGVTFQLASGTPNVGDSFLVQPTRNGARDFKMLISDTAKIAAAAPMRTEDIASRPTDPIKLVFNNPPTSFSVINTTNQGVLAANVPYVSTGNIDYNGWRVQITGAPAANDSFIVNSQAANPSAGNSGGATISNPPAASTVNNNLSNTGTGHISAGSVNSPYDKVTLNFTTATTFDVIDNTTGAALATGQNFVAGGNIDFNGWRMQINGAPAAGDSFIVDKTVTSAGPRNTGIGTTISETIPVPPATEFVPSLYPAAPPQSASTNVQAPVTFLFTSANTFKVYDGNTGAEITPTSVPSMNLNNTSATSPLPYNAATGFSYNSSTGTAIAVNGWSVKLTGNIAVGDRFLVGPNVAGNADNRNALAMGNLQTMNIMSGATASFQSAYSQMVSKIGNQASETKIGLQAQDTLATEAHSAKSSFSGVNLDEEAANLMKYQQAYMAASKVISIAQETFKSILNIG